MSVWNDWGFTRNPYDTNPIPLSADGEVLLVGRAAIVSRLEIDVTSASVIPVLAGDNGVGKTSIASVVSFRVSSQRPGEYMSLPRVLQLRKDDTLATFEAEAYQAIARALVTNDALLQSRGIPISEVNALRRWLDRSESSTKGGGFTTPFGGLNATVGSAQRDGYAALGGLAALVGRWLDVCVDDGSTAGVICIVDNLEVLGSSDSARTALEESRDRLLQQRGLRWILCGTRTVVKGPATSTRMRGRLSTPIDVPALDPADSADVVARRLALFGSEARYVPVEPDGFEIVYSAMGYHLREALSFCQSFAGDLAEAGAPDDSRKLELLRSSIARLADRHASTADGVPARSRQLLVDLAQVGGVVTHVDVDTIGCESEAELLAHSAPLVDEGLAETTVAAGLESGLALKLTADGWLAAFQRNGYSPPR